MSAPPSPATPPDAGPRRPRVALVLGSGSVKCAAAIGLYRCLIRAGIDINLVVGCSGGAMYASIIALGIDPDAAAQMTMQLWTRELTGRRHLPSVLRAFFPRLLGFTEDFGLKDDAAIMRRLHDAFGTRRFSDTRAPLYITATDFRNGEQVVLSEGDLVPAIRASIAMPFAFRPVRIGDRTLVDGFLSDPLPVGVAIREGAGVIVAMGFESNYQSRITNVGRFAFQYSAIMANNLLKAAFAFHGLAHHAEVIPILPEFEGRVGLFDTARLPSIIDAGERAMAEQVPYLTRLLG